MCKGHTVHLTGCGHDIYYFSERCDRDCSVPRGPTCTLADCCAPCDPEHQSREIRQNFDKTNEELITLMDEATKTGEYEVAKKTSEQIMNLNVAMREEQYKVKLKRIFSALDPEFPPVVDMTTLGMDSEWIDGKCIWTDPADNSKTLRRVPRMKEWLPAPGEDDDSLTIEYGDDESDTVTVVPYKEAEFTSCANEELEADTPDVHDDSTEDEFWLKMADLQGNSGETVRQVHPQPAGPRVRSNTAISPRARVNIPQNNLKSPVPGAANSSTGPEVPMRSKAAELKLKQYIPGATNLSAALEACRASRRELKTQSSFSSVSQASSSTEALPGSPGAAGSSKTIHLRPYIPGDSEPFSSTEATSGSSRSRHFN
jgi:hypothetical protein